MSNARLRLAFASKGTDGNHISPCGPLLYEEGKGTPVKLPRPSSAARPARSRFGPSMTALNFLLTRASARTLRSGDEIVVTALDHDANVAPWLEIAHDAGIVVRVAGLTRGLELDHEDLERQLSERTRVVAFPVAGKRRLAQRKV